MRIQPIRGVRPLVTEACQHGVWDILGDITRSDGSESVAEWEFSVRKPKCGPERVAGSCCGGSRRLPEAVVARAIVEEVAPQKRRIGPGTGREHSSDQHDVADRH